MLSRYCIRSHIRHCSSRTNYHNSLRFCTSVLSENQSISVRRRQKQTHEFSKILKLCPTGNPVLHYKQIHAQIVILGFQFDTFLGNILISCYSKYDFLDYARQLFDRMPERNLVTWSSLISMYSQHGYNQEALLIFSEFRSQSVENPNDYILNSVIRVCTRLGSVEKGKQLHGFVVKTGLDQDVYVGTSLTDFYSKFVNIEEAKLVFDDLSVKSAVTWTAFITGYSQIGKSDVSLRLFEEMMKTDVVPDRFVISSVLSACSLLGFLEKGKQIHAYAVRRGIQTDISVSNVIIDLYVKCGKVKLGKTIFDKMVVKDVISWTTMISGYMQNSYDLEAILLFAEMNKSNLKPDAFACTSVLNSCGSVRAPEVGKQVHAYTIKNNLDSDKFVNNSLIDMYSKTDLLVDGRRAFDLVSNHDVISYNAMIEGCSRKENVCEAFALYQEMRVKSVKPSVLTFVSLFSVSAMLLNMELTRQIHCHVIKCGVSFDNFVGSALIDVYSKCSFVKDARLVFDEINEKDIYTWNSMLFGYTQQSDSEEAIKLYLDLKNERVIPDCYTFVALMNSASDLASLSHGQQFHTHLIKTGHESDPFVRNSVVDMYAKCGSLKCAREIFEAEICRDVVCWNSMISTYAHHGEAEEALEMFEEMIQNEIQPNYVTFVSVISACAHAGLVEKGFYYFNSMLRFGVEKGMDHYACMVSLLGRSGNLVEAKEFIEKMPVKPAAIVWRSLLSACRDCCDVELAKQAADLAIESDPTDSGSYILLSNIFASKGMWDEVKKVRKKMEFNMAVKETGCSWIEMNNDVHVFISRDKNHREVDLIYSLLNDLILHIRDFGSVPDSCTVLMNE